jgi:hypothetical protein
MQVPACSFCFARALMLGPVFIEASAITPQSHTDLKYAKIIAWQCTRRQEHYGQMTWYTDTKDDDDAN